MHEYKAPPPPVFVPPHKIAKNIHKLTRFVTRTLLAPPLRVDVPESNLTNVTLLAHDVRTAGTLSGRDIALRNGARIGYRARNETIARLINNLR